MSEQTKKYGIRGTLPPSDPMRSPHLLGEDWQWVRWYETEEERDEAFREAAKKFPYYRNGDQLSLVLTKIER
jgi:hypothetical protein